MGYNKQRHDASIQADLNKLYDTRPTLGSFVSDAFSRNNVQRAATQKAAEEGGSPYFDLNHSGNVTAVLGKTALLNCRVKNIGNKTVSMLTTCVNIAISISSQAKNNLREIELWKKKYADIDENLKIREIIASIVSKLQITLQCGKISVISTSNW